MRPVRRWTTAGVAAISGMLLASSALAGGPTRPIQPAWSMHDVVQEMRDTWRGGTVMPGEATGTVREFHLYIAEIDHELADGVRVKAWAFGLEGQPATVPGPELRVKQGDLVRIHLKNNTDQPHSLHPHGITSVDELNDGVPHVTGAYVMPGQTFTYEFVAREAGTHWYHCHVQTSLHQDMGMYGALIVEENERPDWDREYVSMVDEWDTRRTPADPARKPAFDYYLVNGKAGKAIPDMVLNDGEIARIRLINAGFESHALHLHGTHFVVTHKDGYQLPLPYRADTLNIAPGETYDVLVKGRDGTFPWHDHNSLAVTDAGVYPGGMIMHIRGSEPRRFNPDYNPPRLPLEGEIHGASHAAAVPFDPVAPPPAPGGKVVPFTLEARRVTMEVAPGDRREVWTFNGSVPGPTLRVRQGDTVRFTLINKDPEMAHGIDFHAGQMDMGTFHKAIQPGESLTFDWQARYPGIFYYHCSASPVIMHIANGMFGAVIVDPPDYKPEGKEYVLIQNEWYQPNGSLQDLLTGRPVAVALNGVAMQYTDRPLPARAGQKVRFYFVNAGPNDFSAFHVIGEIFDAVYPDGNPKNIRKGVQTVTVPPGGAVIADLVAEAGTYPVLTHQLNAGTKGALGLLQVSPESNAASGIRVLYNGMPFTGPVSIIANRAYVPVDAFVALTGLHHADVRISGSLTLDGRLYAPVRSLAEEIGATVEWDEATRTVLIRK